MDIGDTASAIALALAIIGFAVALAALVIALLQVRDARRASKLQAEITVIEAYLTAELIGRNDEEILGRRFQELYQRACELAGSEEALRKLVGDIP